jgi:hypothetical protein
LLSRDLANWSSAPRGPHPRAHPYYESGATLFNMSSDVR